MLFADARIVWCRRDPRDIALSIFSESFSPLATYATDIDDIRFCIEEQERLMRHWQSVSPLPILEVQYETMVTDADAQIRRLIDFAGLPWMSAAWISTQRRSSTLRRGRCVSRAYESVGRWRLCQWSVRIDRCATGNAWIGRISGVLRRDAAVPAGAQRGSI